VPETAARVEESVALVLLLVAGGRAMELVI
jgi:hypothetical protein